ncbi:MAG: flagellar protein FlaG [Chitinophagales bacterium]
MDVKPAAGLPSASPSPEVARGAPYQSERPKATPTEPMVKQEGAGEPRPAEKSAEQRKAESAEVASVLEKLNIVMNAMSIQARFEVHQPTKEIMVRVINVESGQLIREIPPKKILDMVAKMQELVGLLVDERG